MRTYEIRPSNCTRGFTNAFLGKRPSYNEAHTLTTMPMTNDEPMVVVVERPDDVGPRAEDQREMTRPSSETHPGTVEISSVDADIDIDIEAGTMEQVERAEAPPGRSQRAERTGLFRFLDRYLSSIGAGDDDSAGDAAVSAAPGKAEDVDVEKQASSSSRTHSSSNPVCLICLEPLSPSDFESGEAISLDCGCRGDLAMRHRECAITWSQVKDDGRGGLPQCELCRKPVKNLPELPRREPPPAQPTSASVPVMIEESYVSDPEQFLPSRADLMFDCVRVTWIAMIVSILFFDANMGLALFTGLVAGMAYLLMLRLLYKQHFEALQAYAEQARQQRDPNGAYPHRFIIRI